MQWTALDLKNLAASLTTSRMRAELPHSKPGELTQLQKIQLTALFGQLDSYGEQLENEALQNALVDIDAAVADLQNAAHDATNALQTISDVQNAISIAVARLAWAWRYSTPPRIDSRLARHVGAGDQLANAKPQRTMALRDARNSLGRIISHLGSRFPPFRQKKSERWARNRGPITRLRPSPSSVNRPQYKTKRSEPSSQFQSPSLCFSLL